MAHLSGRFCFHILRNMAQKNKTNLQDINILLCDGREELLLHRYSSFQQPSSPTAHYNYRAELPHLKSIEYRIQLSEITGIFTPSPTFCNDFIVIKPLISAKYVVRDSFGRNFEDFHNHCEAIFIF